MIQSAINKTIGSIAAISIFKEKNKKEETVESKQNNVSEENSKSQTVAVKSFDEQKALAAQKNLQEQAETAKRIQAQKEANWQAILNAVMQKQGNKPIPKKSEIMKKGENK